MPQQSNVTKREPPLSFLFSHLPLMDNLLLSGDLETAVMFTYGIPLVGGLSHPSEEQHNLFMEACSLCEKRIASDRDVFIYKGDAAFCSEDCRQVQIDMDEATERKQTKASKRMVSSSSSSSPAAGQKVHVRAARMLVVG